MDDAAGDDQTAFPDLVGLGPKGRISFGDIAWPNSLPISMRRSFRASYTPRVNSSSSVNTNDMGVFRVADVLRRLFHEGRVRIQRGPGARGLYLLDMAAAPLSPAGIA